MQPTDHHILLLKISSTELYRMSFYDIALRFPFTNLFQYDNNPVHKDIVFQGWSESAPEPCHQPLFVIIWIELDTSSPDPTPEPNLNNALTAEWTQILTTTHQNLMESLPKRLKDFLTEKGGLHVQLDVQKHIWLWWTNVHKSVIL